MSKLHLVFANERGGGAPALHHTMRDSNGSWDPSGDIMSQAGPIPIVNPNIPVVLIQNFACAVDSTNGDLHVVAVDHLGAVWHTIRTASAFGPWQPWGNVSATVPLAFATKLAIAFSPTAV